MPLKGYKQTEEHKRKLLSSRNGMLGHKHTNETKKKMSESSKNKKHSEETKEKIRKSLIGQKRKPLSNETKEKISKSKIGNKNCVGRKISEETRNKISKSHMGKIISEESRKKQSNSMKGDKSPNWKGGITQELKLIRSSIEYKLWREAVFARDAWTCQECGKIGGTLRAHHIKGFAEYIELRFAIDNGITLCKKCHMKLHNGRG